MMLAPKLGVIILALVVFDGTKALPREIQDKKRPDKERGAYSTVKRGDVTEGQGCALGTDCHQSSRQPKLEFRRLFGCPVGSVCDRAQQNEKREPCPRSKCPETEQNVKGLTTESRTLTHCPPGLWCKKKRDLTKRTVVRLGFSSSSDVAGCPARHLCKKKRQTTASKRLDCQKAWCRRDTLPSCPPGLWCKRNAAEEEKRDSECPAGLRCVRGIEEDYARAAGYSRRFDTSPECPPGLWCKREVHNHPDSLLDCPPGLWCKRDKPDEPRKISAQSSERNLHVSSDNVCPPGLWCKRDATVALKMGFQNSDSIQECPPGLWCKRNEGKSSARKRDAIVRIPACPPGLWCKRDIRQSDAIAMGYESSDASPECPPGLWCKRNHEINPKRIALAAEKQACPPGLWCKRDMPSDAIAMGYESSDSLSECPPGLWCKRNHEINPKRIALAAKKKACPPGLWCKRDIMPSDAIAMGYGSSDSLPECPPGLWCKRSHEINPKRIALAAESRFAKEERNGREHDVEGDERRGRKRQVLKKKFPNLPCPPGLWC